NVPPPPNMHPLSLHDALPILNKARIPEIAQYLIDNPRDYVFSAISASISGAPVNFIPAGDKGMETKIGAIVIPMDAQFIINDGRSEEHTSELQSRENLVCRLL